LQTPPGVNDPVTAAVVGCGGAGTNHTGGYRNSDHATLVGVCDIDADRAESAAEEFDVPAYGSIEDLLDAESPDAVSVTTPERHHVEPTVTALEHGSAVLSEKIMAHTLDGAREMVAAAERTGSTLGVNYNYRHIPLFERLAAGVESDELDDVHLVSADAHAYCWHHTIDLLRFFFGEPDSVRVDHVTDPDAVPEKFRLDGPLYVPGDAAVGTFRFPDGPTATLAATIHADLSEQLLDLSVYGEAGRACVTGVSRTATTGTVAPGPIAEDLRAAESITLQDAFERSVDAFAGAVRRGEAPPTTGEDGLAMVEIEVAAAESARRGERVSL
jgi:predicted dehydrogenase